MHSTQAPPFHPLQLIQRGRVINIYEGTTQSWLIYIEAEAHGRREDRWPLIALHCWFRIWNGSIPSSLLLLPQSHEFASFLKWNYLIYIDPWTLIPSLEEPIVSCCTLLCHLTARGCEETKMRFSKERKKPSTRQTSFQICKYLQQKKGPNRCTAARSFTFYAPLPRTNSLPFLFDFIMGSG